MSRHSKIEWTDATWNPWYGCQKVSSGCKNCYMYRDMHRYGMDPYTVTRSKTKFRDPETWAEPQRVFTCSWSDFFIEQADPWRGEAWEIIRNTPQHTYQVLTKRPENIADRLPDDWGEGYENVWLGVSAENQAAADERLPLLLKTPAQMRFVSAEPLLGPIELSFIGCPECGKSANSWFPNYTICRNCGKEVKSPPDNTLDWVIVGGESGPGTRPTHPDWVRDIRDQCQAAGVPFFFKQWGAWAPMGLLAAEGESRYFTNIGQHLSNDQYTSAEYHESNPCRMVRVGKKQAGRKLDGREWNEYPEMKEAG